MIEYDILYNLGIGYTKEYGKIDINVSDNIETNDNIKNTINNLIKANNKNGYTIFQLSKKYDNSVHYVDNFGNIYSYYIIISYGNNHSYTHSYIKNKKGYCLPNIIIDSIKNSIVFVNYSDSSHSYYNTEIERCDKKTMENNHKFIEQSILIAEDYYNKFTEYDKLLKQLEETNNNHKVEIDNLNKNLSDKDNLIKTLSEKNK